MNPETGQPINRQAAAVKLTFRRGSTTARLAECQSNPRQTAKGAMMFRQVLRTPPKEGIIEFTPLLPARGMA
jgi:hypothetical protein